MWLWIIIVSAIWVLIDAKSIGVRKGVVSGLGNIGPWGWFFVVAFLWIIGFPMYLYYRGKFKEALSTEGGDKRITNESKNGLSFIHWIGIIVFGGIGLLALFGERNDGTTGVGRLVAGQSSVYTIKVTGTEGLAFSGSYMGVSSAILST